MGQYSIKDLEFFSGIKAHTLRIWEQRYHILTPKRSETNIRYYNDEDLKYLLNVSLLYQSNYRISRIAKMDKYEVAKEVFQLSKDEQDRNGRLNELTISMIDMDEEKLEKTLSTNILQEGFEKTMISLLLPFLKKTGILWQTGAINPAQEHFISNLIRQKLIVAIDGQTVTNDPNADKYLLFLPEEENHEIGLLFAHFILKSRQKRVFYLGANVPLRDIQEVVDFTKPDYVFSVFTIRPKNEELSSYVHQLNEICSESELYLTGYQCLSQEFECPSGVNLIHSFDELLKWSSKKGAQ